MSFLDSLLARWRGDLSRYQLVSFLILAFGGAGGGNGGLGGMLLASMMLTSPSGHAESLMSKVIGLGALAIAWPPPGAGGGPGGPPS